LEFALRFIAIPPAWLAKILFLIIILKEEEETL